MDYYELLKTIVITSKLHGDFRFEIFHQQGVYYADIYLRDKETGRWLVYKPWFWLTNSKTLDETISACVRRVEIHGQ